MFRTRDASVITRRRMHWAKYSDSIHPIHVTATMNTKRGLGGTGARQY